MSEKEMQNVEEEAGKKLSLDDLEEVAGGGMAQAHVKDTQEITQDMKDRA